MAESVAIQSSWDAPTGKADVVEPVQTIQQDWDAPAGKADADKLGSGPAPLGFAEPQTPSGSEAQRLHGSGSSGDLASDASGGINRPAASRCPGRRLAPHDEALQRWAAAELADTEHVYFGMRPLENDAVGEAVAIVTMLVCFSWIYVGPLITFAALPLAVFYHSRLAALWLVTLAFLAVAPVKPDFGGWGRAYIWQTWRRYFRMRWVTPRRPYLATDRHYLYLHFPHGVFPMCSFLTMALTGNEDLMGIPERTAGAVATVLLHLPGLRYCMIKMGCHQAGRQNMIGMLQRRSVGIIPEGIAGLFRGANRTREQVYWSPRLGICRIALQTSTSIVPVYDFGQSQVLSFAGSERVSRRLRATVGVFWGRWAAPLPHKTDMIVALGEPIPVKKIPNPSLAEIKELHTRVQDAVQQLYQQHKHLLPELDGKDLTFV